MPKHRASEDSAELQWGSTLIRETPGVRRNPILVLRSGATAYR